MLLSEMVRKIREESRLIDDPTERSTNSTSYTTVASYNIMLEKPSVLIYTYQIRVSSATQYCYARLKIGTLFIGGEGDFSTTYVMKSGIFALGSGSYTVELQIRIGASGITGYVRNFVLGVVSFPDLTLIALRGSGSLNMSVPAGRRTCIGVISRYTMMIQVYNSAAPTVTVNGVTISAAHTDGEKYVYVVSVGSGTHTVSVSAGNFSIIASPWLLPASDSEFISLSFPQGSTLYLVLEPLFANPTKTIKLGKRRAISFGDSTDFYSTASGTGILSWNYTFESVEIEQSVLLVSGFGGCISIIAVDVRT